MIITFIIKSMPNSAIGSLSRYAQKSINSDYLKFILLLVLQTSTAYTSYSQSQNYTALIEKLGQAQGKDRYHLLIELCNQDINNDQELTRVRATEALSIARDIDFTEGIGWSLRYIGLSHHYKGELDSARVYYDLCKDYFEVPKDIGWSYFNIASLYEYESKYDSAIHYLDLAETFFQSDSAIVELASVISMRGTISCYKGNLTEGSSYFYKALKLFEKANDNSRKADMIRQLSSSEAKLGNYTNAISYAKEALIIYKEENDTYYEAYATNVIGAYFFEIDQLDSAEHYFNLAIDLSKLSNNKKITLESLAELTEVYVQKKEYKKVLNTSTEAEQYMSPSNKTYEDVLLLISKGIAYDELNQYHKSLSTLKNSLELAKEIDVLGLQRRINYLLRDVYEKRGNYKEAYNYYQKASIIKDSLDSVSKTEKLQEVLVKYDTERKEKELIISQAEIAKRNAKFKILSISTASLLVLGSIIILALINRHKKNKVIREQEIEIEQEKRVTLERELEFKKKELTAKVLQLASKNEFLQSLEEQVGHLKSSMDNSVSQTSEKISRMIHNDTLDDQEWEQFGKEFSSIHQDFMDRLKQLYGDFSNHEWRLISLLKMNLSSKDIANTLRITPNGVKKARYRLRKKMNLESEVDIQDFLLSY